MNELIKLVIQYKEKKADIIFNKIIKTIQPIIKKYVKKVPRIFEEDLEQELCMGTYEVIKFFNIKKINIPVNIFNKENLVLFKLELYDCIKDNTHKKFIKNFLLYNTELLNSANNTDHNYYQINIEFSLFCTENIFLHILKIRFSWKIKDFYRKYQNDINNKNISLNFIYENNLELMDLIPDNKNKIMEINVFEKFKITKNDEKFLRLFIENEKIISQQAVSKKTNISQQAISKKLKLIKEKYEKMNN